VTDGVYIRGVAWNSVTQIRQISKCLEGNARKYTENFVGCKLKYSRNYAMFGFPKTLRPHYIKLLENRGVPAEE